MSDTCELVLTQSPSAGVPSITQCVAWLRDQQESADLAGSRLIDDMVEDLYRLGSITTDLSDLVVGAMNSIALALEMRPRVRMLGIPVHQ